MWKDDSDYDKDMLIITSETVSKEYLEYLDQNTFPILHQAKRKSTLSERWRY